MSLFEKHSFINLYDILILKKVNKKRTIKYNNFDGNK